MRLIVKGTVLSTVAALTVAVFGAGSSYASIGADPVVTCDFEQNGTVGKITCTVCPGTDFNIFGATSSDPNIVAVTSTTISTVKINGVDCGKILVQVKKKKAGSASVTVDLFGVPDPPPIKYDLTDELFAMAVPGGAGFEEVETSPVQAGQTFTVQLKTIDTVTGADKPTIVGTAIAKLLGSNSFTFDDGSISKTISFSGGVASVTLNSRGLMGRSFLEISDDAAPGSVAGTSVMETAAISLQDVGSAVPTLSEMGVVVLCSLLLIGGATVLFLRGNGPSPMG